MLNKAGSLLFILLAVLIFILGIATERYLIKTKTEVVTSDTTQVSVSMAQPDKPIDIKPIFKTVYKQAPGINLDSLQQALWQEALNYWAQQDTASNDSIIGVPEYIAQMDSTFENENVKTEFSISYISKLPLHPDSFFRLNKLNISYPQITNTVLVKETFWDIIIPDFSLQVGAGFGVINKNFDVFVGLGGSWKLNRR